MHVNPWMVLFVFLLYDAYFAPLPLLFSFMMYRNRLILSAEYDYHDSLFPWVTG